MPYDPYNGSYQFIDEQLAFPQQKQNSHRPAQVLPRKNYDPVALARQARHRAREEAKRQSRTTNRAIPDGEEYDDADIDGNSDVWPPRQHTSTIRYNLPPEGVYQTGNKRLHVEYVDVPPRRSAQTRLPPAPQQQRIRNTDDIDELETERPPKRRRSVVHLHWLAILGIGMVIMLALVVGGNSFISWWQTHQDDSTYGRPRTFQIDMAVGHNDSEANPSHFIVINLNRHIIVIELPGGDSSKARIYNITTLFGNGQELPPVTLSFKDVNGDGLLDMEIHIQDQTTVFINDNGGFRPLKTGEHIHL